MKHYGDITKINGSLVEPVNVVIGGSPCQDLSVAGKQAGLAGERSGLFMEQIRIIKEMRRADLEKGRTGKDTRPRYMVSFQLQQRSRFQHRAPRNRKGGLRTSPRCSYP